MQRIESMASTTVKQLKTEAGAEVKGGGNVKKARVIEKRTFTPDNIVSIVYNMIFGFPAIIRSIFSPKTSKALREKVMLGVTAINDCRYCGWGHSHWE